MMHDCAEALKRIAREAAEGKNVDQILRMFFGSHEMLQPRKGEAGATQ